MTDATIYRVLQCGAAALTIVSVCIATAVNLPDLGLSRQGVAVLAVVQTGISAALLFLPAVSKSPGNVRGDARDNP